MKRLAEEVQATLRWNEHLKAERQAAKRRATQPSTRTHDDIRSDLRGALIGCRVHDTALSKITGVPPVEPKSSGAAAGNKKTRRRNPDLRHAQLVAACEHLQARIREVEALSDLAPQDLKELAAAAAAMYPRYCAAAKRHASVAPRRSR